VGAVLPPLVHNHADVELGVHTGDLSDCHVVVETVNVHRTDHFQLVLQVEDQVEAQVLEGSGLSAGVSVLIVFPTEGKDRLREG